MYDMYKLIEFSSGHMSSSDNDALSVLSGSTHPVIWHYYGHIIVIPDDYDDVEEIIAGIFFMMTPNFIGLFRLAFWLGCSMLALDRDGPIIEGQEVFEW